MCQRVALRSPVAQFPPLVLSAMTVPGQHFSAVAATTVLDIQAIRRLVPVLECAPFDDPKLMGCPAATARLKDKTVAAVA